MRSRQRPAEYTLLYAATLCLLAIGAVMVYSASSATSLLRGSGDPSFFLKKYLVFGLLGLIVLHVLSRGGLKTVKLLTPLILLGGFVLTAAVMVPGVGVEVNGATRWLGAGPVQFQPSELLKLGLVLYSAQLLAARPSATRSLSALAKPLLVVVSGALILLMLQPDMGTSLVCSMGVAALLVAAGVPRRTLVQIALIVIALATIVALIEPYRRARLTAFLDPWDDASGSGFQSIQAMIAIGSGGLFGQGLGESVQKIFYLPEAHTDMILAVIGEEWGIAGIAGVAALFAAIAYAGLRSAKLAKDRYSKLLAAGITGLIVSQAALNFFAVLGMAPLTGVPLPFISYGSSNLIVMLAATGILLNIAAGGKKAPAARRKPTRKPQTAHRRQRPRAARAA